MGSLQAPSNLDREGQGLRNIEPLDVADPLLQVLPIDVLENDVRRLILLVSVDHANDIWR